MKTVAVLLSMVGCLAAWGFVSEFRERGEELEYYKDSMRKVGRTLCERKKKEHPEWFKIDGGTCGCNGWTWTEDTMDVGVTCILDKGPK